MLVVILAGGAFYLWQKSEEGRTTVEPLSYLINESMIAVSEEVVAFDYTSEGLMLAAQECGNQKTKEYFDSLVLKFDNTNKTIYNFEYTGESQGGNTFTAIVIPNKASYSSLDEFKKDFDLCQAGGSAYPTALNNDWLLFISSCGTGFGDGSNSPNGCQ